MRIVKTLKDVGLLKVEQPFVTDTELEVIMGSTAYGANDPNSSDVDVHGFCVPNMDIVFPQTIKGGYVEGFTKRPQNFESFHQHHMSYDNKEYDVCVYSIVKLFSLAVDNNPNILEILWTPDDCVLRQTEIGKTVRDIRQLFLSKASYHRFRGFAHAQKKSLYKSNRKELIDKYGFDVKNAYHMIRLALQGKQILETGDMVLNKDADLYKDIRTGKYTLQEIEEMFAGLEADLDNLFKTSDLRYSADTKNLQKGLMACLEMKYGFVPC